MLDRLISFRECVEAALHYPHALLRADVTEDKDVLRADVTEDKDAYHFYLEMPGLKVGSIDVEVEDDMLIVSAERSRPERPQGIQVHIAERRYGPIKRAFTLPHNARRDGIRDLY